VNLGIVIAALLSRSTRRSARSPPDVDVAVVGEPETLHAARAAGRVKRG
jgi:hypothetical protein